MPSESSDRKDSTEHGRNSSLPALADGTGVPPEKELVCEEPLIHRSCRINTIDK